MGPKRRGLSLDDKRQVIMDLFFETRDVMTLKELEKAAGKRGVTTQTVKEVADGLVSDDMLIVEKIGASNYYWMFPSEAARVRESKLERLGPLIEKEENAVKALEAEIVEVLKLRDGGSIRDDMLARRNELVERSRKLGMQLQMYAENDPKEFHRLEAEVARARDNVNTWTDNIWVIQSYCKKQFGMETRAFCESFQVDPEIDYI